MMTSALFIIGVVIVMTTVLVICVKLECFKAMAIYLGFMLFMLLGFSWSKKTMEVLVQRKQCMAEVQLYVMG